MAVVKGCWLNYGWTKKDVAVYFAKFERMSSPTPGALLEMPPKCAAYPSAGGPGSTHNRKQTKVGRANDSVSMRRNIPC